MSNRCGLSVAVVIAVLSWCVAPLQAGTVVADFNDLSTGNLGGQAGGTGLSGTWDSGTGTIDVVGGDLTSALYSMPQAGTPRSVQGDYSTGRQQNRALAAPMAGSIWFSFLANNAESGDRSGITLDNSGYATNKKGQVLLLGDDLRFNIADGYSGSDFVQADNVVPLGQTTLIVGKMNVQSGNDYIKLWVNPDLASDPDIANHVPALSSSGFDIGADLTRVGVLSYYYSSGAPVGGVVDNLRVSDTPTALTDVTGVAGPPPVAAHEPFRTGAGDYTTNTTVGGQNPPVTGFTDPWNSPGTTTFKPQPAGLEYYTPDGTQKLATSGGALHADVPNTANREIARALDYDVADLGNHTLYVSGLVTFPEAGTTNNGGFAMVKLVDTDGSGLGSEDFGIQFGVNQGDIRIRARQNSANVGKDFTVQEGYVPGQAYLFVIKSEINANSWQDRTSVWLSPADLASEAAAGTPQISNLMLGNLNQLGTQALDGLRLRTVNFNAGGSVVFDEIRMGSSWAAAVPMEAVAAQGMTAYEPFDYGNPQNVNTGTMAGGSGWSGAWDANGTGTFQSELPPDGPLSFVSPGVEVRGRDRALRIRGWQTNSGDRSITRDFAAPITDSEVWISSLLRWEAGETATGNDYVGIGFDGVVSMGVKGGQGPGGEDLFVRIAGGTEAYGGQLVEGEDYFLVGRLRKSDPDGNYDVFDLWVNPSLADLNNPDATSFGDSGLSQLDMLQIRQVNLDTNEFVWIDELRLGPTFFDVAPVPEPATVALSLLGVSALGGYLRRRRKA